MKRCPVRVSWLLVPLLVLAILAVAAVPASADGIIIPRPPVGRPPVPWRDVALTVKYHRVDVTIKDQVATTHVDQVFVNDNSFVVEGTYLFPLPEDAAISSFDMWVDGQKLEGKLLGREEARAIYEDIVRQQKDPALLEYVGRGAFQASIFPIQPGAERRIELTYAQVLPQAGGLVHYRYPLNTEKFSARPVADVSVTVHIEDKSPLRAIYSPSHAVDVTRDGDRRATASYEVSQARPDRDFDLYYSVSPDDIAANLLSYKPFDEDGYFLLLVTPPVEAKGAERVAKDVVLVLDTSGSMDGEKIVQARAAANYVLDHLGAEDRYNIVSFSTATHLFSEELVPANRRAEGHAFVDQLQAQGSTDINRALLEAVSGVDPQRPTIVIFLTDGLPTVGELNPDQILANVQRSAPKSVRLFTFGVGFDVDTTLLDQLSSTLRGASAYVKPDQQIDEEVSGLYSKVSSPVLVDVDAAFSGVQVDDLYPYPLPDLFAGTQLVVAGRYHEGGTATLTLRGTVNGQPQSYSYSGLTFANRGGNEFIPRLWAQRKIGYLLAQIRLHGVKDELVKEVVALSTRHGIVTPYTSFLVQEPQLALTEAGRNQLSQAPQGGAAPAAAATMAPAARSGAGAVERSAAEKALESADQSLASTAPELQQVGDKAFLLHDGVWQDTAFDANTMKAEEIEFGSDRYFQLLAQAPELGRYLALGDRVIVVLGGIAYSIGVQGASAPVPGVGTPETGTRTTPATATPQAVARGGDSTGQTAPTAAPAQLPAVPAVTNLPGVCSGSAVIGMIGLILPLWLRRRSQ